MNNFEETSLLENTKTGLIRITRSPGTNLSQMHCVLRGKWHMVHGPKEQVRRYMKLLNYKSMGE